MWAFSSFQIQYLRFHGIAEFQVDRILLEVISEHDRHLNRCVPQLEDLDFLIKDLVDQSNFQLTTLRMNL